MMRTSWHRGGRLTAYTGLQQAHCQHKVFNKSFCTANNATYAQDATLIDMTPALTPPALLSQDSPEIRRHCDSCSAILAVGPSSSELQEKASKADGCEFDELLKALKLMMRCRLHSPQAHHGEAQLDPAKQPGPSFHASETHLKKSRPHFKIHLPPLKTRP